jgi:hypothetical protein
MIAILTILKTNSKVSDYQIPRTNPPLPNFQLIFEHWTLVQRNLSNWIGVELKLDLYPSRSIRDLDYIDKASRPILDFVKAVINEDFRYIPLIKDYLNHIATHFQSIDTMSADVIKDLESFSKNIDEQIEQIKEILALLPPSNDVVTDLIKQMEEFIISIGALHACTDFINSKWAVLQAKEEKIRLQLKRADSNFNKNKWGNLLPDLENIQHDSNNLVPGFKELDLNGLSGNEQIHSSSKTFSKPNYDGVLND